MGKFTRWAIRLSLVLWHRGRSRDALVERFLIGLNARLAVLQDAADREVIIAIVETEFEPLFGISAGTLRRRLTQE